MKKRSLPDDNMKKGTRGFYAALGISAVMIGSACFFAYGQDGGKGKTPSSPGTIVAKRADDIPKTTQYRYTVTTAPPVTTAAVTTTAPPSTQSAVIVTIPAAEIVTEAKTEKQTEPPEKSMRLENAHLPLADCSTILADFSGGELVKNPTTGTWQTHNGVDIKAEPGAEVYAVSAGEIMKTDSDPLWGTTVILDHHNGYITKYCGLGTDLSVQEGNMIAAGEVIGAAGDTADIESGIEPHLHIEITHNGKFVDPMKLLR